MLSVLTIKNTNKELAVLLTKLSSLAWKINLEKSFLSEQNADDEINCLESKVKQLEELTVLLQGELIQRTQLLPSLSLTSSRVLLRCQVENRYLKLSREKLIQ